MAHILVLNNADLRPALESVACGATPDHHLFGLNYFERQGHTVTLVPFKRSHGLQAANRTLRRFPVPLGDLDQQRSVLRLARQADLIYAPSQQVTQTLSYLRAWGAFKRPIVCVVHSPLDRGRLSRPRRLAMRALLRGLDAYPALSAPVAKELAEIGSKPQRTGVLRWGPDADFYPAGSRPGRGVVAAGRINRDFETLARAAAQTDVPVSIVCTEQSRPQVELGENTVVISRPKGDALAYRELVELYAQARAIAIPLRWEWPWTMNGLTSLVDALGMGKPVIVTRHPLLEIDVQELGIGLSVAAGDVSGWREAIRYLDEHEEIAAEMGRRARALVDTGVYSSSAFAEQVLRIFDRVLGH